MMEALKRLQEYGYTFSLHEGKIKYQFMGCGRPEDSKVKPLLLQIRDNKAAAMRYLMAKEASRRFTPKTNICYLPQVISTVRQLIQGIADEALAAGWTKEQLDRLSQTLQVFLPCRIRRVTVRAIEIQTMYPDGNYRGSLNFYNDQVDQPWIKAKQG